MTSKPLPPAIRVVNVHKAFAGKPVLAGINLELACGEMLVVLGGSGSGKSVFLKHLNGLLQPDRGQVEVLGEPVSGRPEPELINLRRKVSYIFQHGALFDSLTVGENVAFPLLEHTQLSKSEVRHKVVQLLRRVGLEGTEDLMPAELSGGMRKRVALARGLALDPQVILYDEPTAGLDPLTGEAITELIRDVAEETCATSVVVTHDLLVARSLGSKVAYLSHGVFSFVGGLAEAATLPGELARFVRAGGWHVGA
ncbi:MAG: ATP-binding cassette domain-containing protein [Thermoanaerobaculum sp.]|nr:ATP-binding cassette domain-containing protein [Thermoanaerobaculum sp.]